MDAPSQARQALEALDDVGDAEGKRIYNQTLRAALAPLANLPPLAFCCVVCEKRIAWWALDPNIAVVIATERKTSTKGRGPSRPGLAGRGEREHHGFQVWIESAMKPGGRIELVDVNTSGFPTRLKFRCRCGADYTTTNTRRLRAYLSAVSVGTSRIYHSTRPRDR